MIFDSCVTVVADAGGRQTRRSKLAEAGPQSRGMQPILNDTERINLRMSELRTLGKPAVEKLCQELRVNPNSTNLTVLISALVNQEEMNREEEEQNQGKAC
jgi:hypothetical protein